MSSRSFVLFTSIVLSCSAAVACGDDEGGKDGTGGAPGSGGAQGSGGSGSGGGDTCPVEPNSSAPAVSFKTDVMPIFGFACAGSACHSTGRKAGLYLGPKCDFDSATRKCNYPTAADPDPNKSQPLTDANVLEVYNALKEASKTAPAVKRVEPGDADASFLVDKVAGIQNDKSLSCTNQDPNVAKAGPCGDPMPLVGGPLCNTGSTGQTRLDTIVNWVAQGAPNN